MTPHFRGKGNDLEWNGLLNGHSLSSLGACDVKVRFECYLQVSDEFLGVTILLTSKLTRVLLEGSAQCSREGVRKKVVFSGDCTCSAIYVLLSELAGAKTAAGPGLLICGQPLVVLLWQ